MSLNFDRFEKMRAEGRLLRGKWTGTDAQGRELACWLAALSEPVAEAESADACPADDMPQWLAVLIPRLDDNISQDGWDDRARRLGAALRLTVGWTPAQWRRCEARVFLAILAEARSHVRESETVALSAVDAVVALWSRVLAGDEPFVAEWRAAAAAARAAARAARAASAEAWAARAAARAARAARAASAEAAEAWAARAASAEAAEAWAAWSAEAAARAAWAAWSAEAWAAWSAEAAAEAAARAAEAWDRICDGVIAALEAER